MLNLSHIVLDATAYRADPLLRGNAFRILLAGLGRVGAKLLVPEVVFDEVVNGFRERLQLLAARADAVETDARRLGLSAEVFTQRIDVATETEKYRTTLLHELGVELLPLPDLSHHELVKRALQRRKPFNQSGAGYRDALIWQHVLDSLKSTSQNVCFVTANRRDFWDGKALHTHLIEDLANAGIAADRLHLHEKLEDLNAALILPRLEHLNRVFDEISKGEWGKFNLTHWVYDHILDAIRDEDLGQFLSRLHDEGASVYLSKIKRVYKVTVDDVRAIPDGKVLISASTKIQAEISVTIDWDEYQRSAELRTFVGPMDEPFKWVIDRRGTSRIRFFFSHRACEYTASNLSSD
jgi:hypothetical protein